MADLAPEPKPSPPPPLPPPPDPAAPPTPPTAAATAQTLDAADQSEQPQSGGRAFITHTMLSQMVASYRSHFATYVKTRNTRVGQRLPSKVWTEVYAEVKDCSGFQAVKEDSLKKQLKATLDNMKDGEDEDPEAEGSATAARGPLTAGILARAVSAAARAPSGETDTDGETAAASKPSTPCPDREPVSHTVSSLASTMSAFIAERTRESASYEATQKRKLELQQSLLEVRQKQAKIEEDKAARSTALEAARVEIERQRMEYDRETAAEKLKIEMAGLKMKQFVELFQSGIITKEELLARLDSM
ncbi:hypothetical protein HK405_000254 [Cladochytrium tenue]|nr:hypothetical protein HK405_000254 [Cladochytrium tenue]